MNIGIITFHSAHNYGAMLQAFALQKYIKNNYNCNVKNINFNTDKDIKAYKIFKKHKKIHSYIWEILKFLHYSELKKRHNSFELFLKNYIDTTERYSTYEKLIENPPQFDVYISGSDQVFSPKGKELNAYYLNFGPNHIKKIAYAPSFGYTSIPDDIKEIIKKLLLRFNYLSAREKSGCQIIKDLIYKDVPNVVDPVFLIDPTEYRKISNPVKLKYENYILCYSLVGIKKQIAIACRLKEITGLPIVLIRDTALLPIKCVDKIIRFAGPREFLWLLDNAKYVVTDSFHGTSFSLIFKKNFFSVIAFPEKADRIYSILKEIGLDSRIVYKPGEINKQDLYIDYEAPSEKLQAKIQLSKEFLHKALQ